MPVRHLRGRYLNEATVISSMLCMEQGLHGRPCRAPKPRTLDLEQGLHLRPPRGDRGQLLLQAGAYTRPLLSSTSAVSDTQKHPTHPIHPLTLP